MKSNIYKYYIYAATSNFLFFLPIVYVFFQKNGLSLTQIFIVEAIFSAGLVLFEVPTGAVADYFGKKTSLVAGSCIWTLSCIVFAVGSNFYLFTLAYLIWALGAALLSGADTALLYDILSKKNKKEHFKRYQGNAKVIGLASISLTSLLGGYLASFSMRYTFVGSAVAFAVMLMVLITIEHQEDKEERAESYAQVIRNSFSTIRQSRVLMWLFAYAALFMVVFKLMQPSTQIYMKLSELGIEYFGLASAIFFLVSASGAKCADGFEKRFGKYSYLVLSLMMVGSVFLVSRFVSKFSFLILGMLFFAFPVNSIIIQHEILQGAPKSRHSTVLSFNNLFARLLFIVLSPLWGYTSQQSGLTEAFFYASLVITVLVSILMVCYFLQIQPLSETKTEADISAKASSPVKKESF